MAIAGDILRRRVNSPCFALADSGLRPDAAADRGTRASCRYHEWRHLGSSAVTYIDRVPLGRMGATRTCATPTPTFFDTLEPRLLLSDTTPPTASFAATA